MMVVRLECWVRFLVEGRVRLPLDKRLTFGLRRANPGHLDFRGSIHATRMQYQSLILKEASTKVHKHPTPDNTDRLKGG